MTSVQSPGHQEHIALSLISPTVIQVGLETTSTVVCQEKAQCQSLLSFANANIPRSLVNLLLKHRLKHIQWSTASESSNTIHEMSSGPFVPSGLSVEIDLSEPTNELSQSNLVSILTYLQDHRHVLAPLGSVSMERLHRFTVRDGTMVKVNLPMDGTAFSREALQDSQCGILKGRSSWSETILLGGEVVSQRKLWTKLSYNIKDDGSFVIIMREGIQYGRRWDGTSLSLQQLLPSHSKLSPCPWTTEARIQTNWPSSLDISFANVPINQDTNGTVGTATHDSFPHDLSQSFLQVKDSQVSWISQPQGRLYKTVRRPKGVSNSGTIETIIYNDSDESPADVMLYTIIPTYIRPTSVVLSNSNGDVSSAHLSVIHDWLIRHEMQLPPQSFATLKIDYDPVLLPFQQFPPDPNRGMELPPSWVHWNSSTATSSTLYSNALLIMPPVPDMSMPFNVISLTCTLYVFIIGSIINQLVQKAEDRVYYRLYPDKKPKSKLVKLKENILSKLRKKVKDEVSSDTKEESSKIDSEGEKGEEASSMDDYVPTAAVETEQDNTVPFILTEQQRQQLARMGLPMAVSSRTWRRLYSLERDGDSFSSFALKIRDVNPTLLVVKTTRGHVFGGFTQQKWSHRHQNGGGHAFLYSFANNGSDESVVYKWIGSGVGSVQLLDANKKRIIMGGGGSGDTDFGLCLEDGFVQGSTSSCDMFASPPLCPDEIFDILNVEVYGFITGTF